MNMEPTQKPDDFSDREDEDIAVARSERPIRADFLDLQGTCTLTVDIFQKLIEK